MMKYVNALFLLNTLCDNIIQLFFGTARNHQHQKNGERQNIYERKQTKIALEQWALLESQKFVRVGDYLLGSVRIHETHPFFVRPKQTEKLVYSNSNLCKQNDALTDETIPRRFLEHRWCSTFCFNVN